ncbi:hypothetical protein IMCC12053_577 [Celeribacter marinus]|uniref:Uncharacterized protein n=1 Tax=Celeribacter marinus TaxID=1397108 RepID=A0A0N7HI86_9RHOB|nr:hypothetical protein IMCC12053_577 [Celeribacter marinus]
MKILTFLRRVVTDFRNPMWYLCNVRPVSDRCGAPPESIGIAT